MTSQEWKVSSLRDIGCPALPCLSTSPSPHPSNPHPPQRTALSKEDIISEVESLERQGHRRLLVLTGEHPKYTFDQFLEVGGAGSLNPADAALLLILLHMSACLPADHHCPCCPVMLPSSTG
jgi:hypothetical protein